MNEKDQNTRDRPFMLQIINNKSVKGPNFVVTIRDIHHVEYVEGGKTANIEIEGGAPEPRQIEWLVYAQTLRKWLFPHESEPFDTIKRREVLEKVSESLTLLGMPHRIIE